VFNPLNHNGNCMQHLLGHIKCIFMCFVSFLQLTNYLLLNGQTTKRDSIDSEEGVKDKGTASPSGPRVKS
jgi:hypothetical protein